MFENLPINAMMLCFVLVHRLQTIVMLLILFNVFLLMWNTFLFSYGLLGSLFSEMRTFVVMFPLYFILGNAFNIWRIVGGGNIWFTALYNAVFAIHSIIAAMFYSSAFVTALHLANPKLYDELKWFT